MCNLSKSIFNKGMDSATRKYILKDFEIGNKTDSQIAEFYEVQENYVRQLHKEWLNSQNSVNAIQ